MYHTHAQTTWQHRFASAFPLVLLSSLPLNAAAQTAPGTLSVPHIAQAATLNVGDTAWMLASTALVLMMTIPGLALFYAGMVRKKNILGATMQVFATTVLVTLLWFVAGYILLKIIDALIGLRVGADEEEAGLDVSQHGERIE